MARKRRSGEQGSKRRRADGGEPSPPDSDYLLDAAEEQWQQLLMAYRQFEDRKLVVLLDIQEQRIHVYPYADFLDDLSDKRQPTRRHQYERAIQENKIVVFVKDNEQRRLVSFSMPDESHDHRKTDFSP